MCRLTRIFRFWPVLLTAAVLLLPPERSHPLVIMSTVQTLVVQTDHPGMVRVTLREPEVPVYTLHPERDEEGPLPASRLLRTPHGGRSDARPRSVL